MPAPLLAVRGYPTRHSDQVRLVRSRPAVAWLALFAAFALLLPLFASDFVTTVAVAVLMTFVGAVALNLLMGTAGVVSLGAAAFLAIGGFIASALAIDAHLTFVVVVIGAGLGTALVGALVGLFTLRLVGLYIVMATFALHYVVLYALGEYQSYRVGANEFIMPIPRIGPWQIYTQQSWYYVDLGVALLTCLVAANILRSSVGRSWSAMRDKSLAAEALGINAARARIVAFTVTSGMFGVAGALGAYYLSTVSVDNYSLDTAIQYVAIIIIGGLGSVLGSMLGTVFVVILPYIVTEAITYWLASVPGISALGQDTYEVQAGLYGVAIIAFMLFQPDGLASIWTHRLRGTVKAWPLRRQWTGDE
jgi:branched-chain amino acid transport system permease protein